MIGIYKITNLINGKCYIGQSVHIERRFSEHCRPSSTSVIAKAIQKYGKENFFFFFLEECDLESLNYKEQYWIKHFNSLIPNGYNVTEDTESTHTNYRFFEKDTIISIISDLKDSNLSLKEISEKYGLNISNISRINSGETHRQQGLSYPIRKTNWHKREKNFCINCGKEISLTATRCIKCENSFRQVKLEDMRITREELNKKIRTQSFLSIGKEFGISDNAIRKWCDKFNLPRTKKEIKSYSDKEWDLV